MKNYLHQQLFDRIIKVDKRFKFDLENCVNNSEWHDIFFHKTNNIPNLSHSGIEKISFKSKKLSRNKSNNSILFHEEIIIFSDEKGSI